MRQERLIIIEKSLKDLLYASKEHDEIHHGKNVSSFNTIFIRCVLDLIDEIKVMDQVKND